MTTPPKKLPKEERQERIRERDRQKHHRKKVGLTNARKNEIIMC